MPAQEFDAKILKAEDYPGDAAYVEIPYDIQAAYGTRGQVKVKAYFDGFLYRGSIAPMGKMGKHCIIARQDVRRAIGKKPGDTVHMIVEVDTEPRIVVVPVDFATALAAAGLREKFDALSYSHRREHVEAILEAKKPETRKRRIQKACDMIAGKKKD